MRRVFVFFGLLFVIIKSSDAQNVSRIDSLKHMIEYAEGIEKVKVYENIAWEYRKSKPDSTVVFAQKSIDLVKKLKPNRSIAKALNFIALAYHYQGENVLAYDYYNLALTESSKKSDSLQYAHTLNSLGRLFRVQGDYIRSYDYLFQAIEIFEKLDNKDGLSYVYKSLSKLYKTQDKFSKSLEMAMKSFEIREELNNISAQVSSLVEIASIYENMESYDMADLHYGMALEKAKSINDEINIASIYLGICKLYQEQNRTNEALQVANRALDIASGTINKKLTNQIRLELGKVLFDQKKYDDAKLQLERIIADQDVLKELFEQKEAHFYLSEIEKQLGNTKKAFDYFVTHTSLNETLESTETAREIERLESRLEIDKKSRENAILKANNTANKAELSQQRTINIALVVIALVVSFLLTTIWYASRRTRMVNDELRQMNQRIESQKEKLQVQGDKIDKQNKKLHKRNRELSDLNKEKDTLVNIVAHDLKSPLNQIKGLLTLFQTTTLDEDQKTYLRMISETSDSGLNVITDLLDVNQFEEEKSRLNIESIDIQELLQSKARSFLSEAESKGIEIIVEAEGDPVYTETDKSYLSRVLDNLISNALKFSPKNTKVELVSYQEGDSVFVKVKDQGPGFSEDDQKFMYKKFKKLSARPTAGENSHGLGLAIVKTLLNRMDAHIYLESEMGEGSEFTVKLEASKKVKPDLV